MPYELFLALRNLRARRTSRRKLARATALASVLGIAFGVAALVVALALSRGFRDEMRDKILRGTAHVTVMRRDGRALPDWPALVRSVREVEGVADAAPTTYDGALLSGAGTSAYAVLRGLDPASPRAVAEVRRNLVAGSIQPLLDEPSPFTNSEGVETSPGRRIEKSPITSFDEIPSEAATPSAVVGSELAARANLRVGDLATVVSGEGVLTPLGL